MRGLLISLILTVSLCLCPSPSFWHGFFYKIDPDSGKLSYFLLAKIQLLMIKIEENHEFKQLFAHFTLMAICAFYTCKTIVQKNSILYNQKRKIISISILFIFALSYIIELLQSTLPSSFSRGFAWVDIAYSILGGSIGILIFISWNRKD